MNYNEDKRNLQKEFSCLLDIAKNSCNYVTHNDEIWTYFKPKKKVLGLHEQGFKIHLSATILNISKVFKVFWEYIHTRDVEWKVLSSFRMLERQNIGFNGYSQIGKFITIYPYNDNAFEELLNDLELIFKQYISIKIPSDFQYMLSNVVYYRYGDILGGDNAFVDKRDRSIPATIKVPIDDYYIKRYSCLPEHLFIIEIIKQSGKNTVMKALDLRLGKVVYLKEAAYLCNVDIYGADSVNRLKCEKRALKKLEKLECNPRLIDDFYVSDHYFLELLEIKGVPLLNFLQGNIDLSFTEKLEIYIKIINRIKEMMEIGIIYTDISFSNILINDDNEIIIIDFEYCKIVDGWNPPDIIAGCIGFYDPKYLNIDEGRCVFSLTALLLYMEKFNEIKHIFNTKDEEKFFDYMQKEFYNDSNLLEVYSKGFSHNIASIDELKILVLKVFNSGTKE